MSRLTKKFLISFLSPMVKPHLYKSQITRKALNLSFFNIRHTMANPTEVNSNIKKHISFALICDVSSMCGEYADSRNNVNLSNVPFLMLSVLYFCPKTLFAYPNHQLSRRTLVNYMT